MESQPGYLRRLVLNLAAATVVLSGTAWAVKASVEEPAHARVPAKATTLTLDHGVVLAQLQNGEQPAARTSLQHATLTVFSDFQCPACKRFAPQMKQLMHQYGEKLRVVFRNYPLPQHKNAVPAAIAAEAAARQGKFESMHDRLFAEQDRWSAAANPQPMFVQFAGAIGLDTNKFKTDSKSPDIRRKVDRDIELADEAELEMTPTVVLDGTKYTGKSLKDLSGIIDEAINKTAHR